MSEERKKRVEAFLKDERIKKYGREKTVGEISYDLAQKPLETTDPKEQAREQLKEYEDNILICVEKNKKEIKGDFFVVVLTKNEKLMPNVFRHFFFARHTCPTPNYDQAVYKYYANDERLDLIWVIPDRNSSHWIKDNALTIPKDHKQLLNFVLDFDDGSLYKLCKKLNGEEEHSNLLEK